MGDKHLSVRQAITDIFDSNHRCYGYRRLQASLTRQDITISEKVVQRLMKQEQERWSRSFEQLNPVAKRDPGGYAACICANGNPAK